MGFLKFSKLESQQTIRNVAVKTLKGISGLSMHAHNIITSEFIKEFYRYF